MRANSRLVDMRNGDRARRVGSGLFLGAAALVIPFVAEPLTGSSGATVGAVAGSFVLFALAAAVWPHDWSREEERHHRLEAIWRELRTDADAHTPWHRYAAWVEQDDDGVELMLIRCAPVAERFGGAPSPYTRRSRTRLEPDDMGTGAEAMEKLRQRAMQLEEQARRRYERGLVEAEQAAHEETLRAVDEAAASYEREQEERARRELAEQEAAERKAQAEALARALRRP